MSITFLGTMRIETRPAVRNIRFSKMTIEVNHEDYDKLNKIYSEGYWRNKTELLEYCLYAGMAQLEKRMKENQKLEIIDLDGYGVE